MQAQVDQQAEQFAEDQDRQDQELEDYKEKVQADQEAQDLATSDLDDRVSEGEAKQRQIELALEELSVTKGSVARYEVKGTSIGIATRNGELYVNSPNAEDVTADWFAV